MKVDHLMTREIQVCKAHESLNRAAQIMWERDCGFVPVISSNGNGALIGVVTDRDIAMATYIQGKPPLAIPLSRLISRKPISCHADDDITKAEALMRANQVRRLPVVDRSGHMVGVLSLNDIAREVRREKGAGRKREVTAKTLSETLAAIGEPRLTSEGSRIVDLDYVE
ncbi:MAG: CBS domain-containing protein [Candidatus Binatus sp.]|uniref:CBS domain-containing protein n=1 Tax=Candidatus Binatus sp. TaxID=2811406 RepID=UPI003BAF3E65